MQQRPCDNTMVKHANERGLYQPEQRHKALKWWNDLSINEMKAFTKQYYPFSDWVMVNQMPSRIEDIYLKELSNESRAGNKEQPTGH